MGILQVWLKIMVDNQNRISSNLRVINAIEILKKKYILGVYYSFNKNQNICDWHKENRSGRWKNSKQQQQTQWSYQIPIIKLAGITRDSKGTEVELTEIKSGFLDEKKKTALIK